MLISGVGPVASREQIFADLMGNQTNGGQFRRFPCPVEPVIFDLMDEIVFYAKEVYINWWETHFWPGTSPAEQNAARLCPRVRVAARD